MGCKYEINCAGYPFNGEYSDNWSGDNFLVFITMLIRFHSKYPIVNAYIRNFEEE